MTCQNSGGRVMNIKTVRPACSTSRHKGRQVDFLLLSARHKLTKNHNHTVCVELWYTCSLDYVVPQYNQYATPSLLLSLHKSYRLDARSRNSLSKMEVLSHVSVPINMYLVWCHPVRWERVMDSWLHSCLQLNSVQFKFKRLYCPLQS